MRLRLFGGSFKGNPNPHRNQNKEWDKKQYERALSDMKYLNGVLATQPFAAGEDSSAPRMNKHFAAGFLLPSSREDEIAVA